MLFLCYLLITRMLFPRTLELHLTYSPISLFKWQMYVSQKMRSQWNKYLGDTAQQSDEEEDMLKVGFISFHGFALRQALDVFLMHLFLLFKNKGTIIPKSCTPRKQSHKVSINLGYLKNPHKVSVIPNKILKIFES